MYIDGMDLEKVKRLSLMPGYPKLDKQFLPNDNSDGLNDRLDKLKLDPDVELDIRQNVILFDYYGIPFSWTRIFESHGLLTEYEAIRPENEDAETPSQGFPNQLPELDFAIRVLKDVAPIGEIGESMLRDRVRILGVAGYRIDINKAYWETKKLLEAYARLEAEYRASE